MLRLYTDESPGLKVDPMVVLVLAIVFIFSVVALHSESGIQQMGWIMDDDDDDDADGLCSHCKAYAPLLELESRLEGEDSGGWWKKKKGGWLIRHALVWVSGLDGAWERKGNERKGKRGR